MRITSTSRSFGGVPPQIAEQNPAAAHQSKYRKKQNWRNKLCLKQGSNRSPKIISTCNINLGSPEYKLKTVDNMDFKTCTRAAHSWTSAFKLTDWNPGIEVSGGVLLKMADISYLHYSFVFADSKVQTNAMSDLPAIFAVDPFHWTEKPSSKWQPKCWDRDCFLWGQLSTIYIYTYICIICIYLYH